MSTTAGSGSVFSKIKKYIIGLSVGVGILLLLLFISSLILTIDSVSDSFAVVFTIISLCISTFISGLITTLMIGNKGLANGFVVGLIFFIIQLCVSLFIPGSNVFSYMTLIYLLIDIVCSSIGGILSVNMSR